MEKLCCERFIHTHCNESINDKAYSPHHILQCHPLLILIWLGVVAMPFFFYIHLLATCFLLFDLWSLVLWLSRNSLCRLSYTLCRLDTKDQKLANEPKNKKQTVVTIIDDLNFHLLTTIHILILIIQYNGRNYNNFIHSKNNLENDGTKPPHNSYLHEPLLTT